MYALVETSGRQYRVSPGESIRVDRLGLEPGEDLVLDRVLLVKDDELRIGTPYVSGAQVHARVLDHGRGKKVIAFKYSRRKRTRRKVGFRHSYTTLQIVGIQV